MITKDLLQSWSPCIEGYKRFCELFPDGATLNEAIEGLVADGHDDWAYWLFNRCRHAGLFIEVTSIGYRNSGDRNSGYRNSGNGNSGDWNSGGGNSGGWNSGNRNSGNWNSGDRNSGNWNSGNGNSGGWNSGGGNSGGWNSGNGNSGNRNSGDRNSGNWNSGNGNSGDWNSGDRNSGNRNSGNWNSGGGNSGNFNVDTPEVIRVFGVNCLKSVWESSYKPAFLYFQLTQWVDTSQMSEEEKLEFPFHVLTGGRLRTYSYKDAFQRSWDTADPVDRVKVKDLPHFNAQIFFEISGIDLRDPA